jgi:hypothetical protein
MQAGFTVRISQCRAIEHIRSAMLLRACRHDALGDRRRHVQFRRTARQPGYVAMPSARTRSASRYGL